tara:strand:- start:47 stop:493 length:447 start_codon:yes stop_codon:yes gene_type:complete
MSIFTKDPVAEENIVRQKVELVLNRQTETLHQLVAITKQLEQVMKVLTRVALDVSSKAAKPDETKQLTFAPIKRTYIAGKKDLARLQQLHDFMSGDIPVNLPTLQGIWSCTEKAASGTIWRFDKDERFIVERIKIQGQPTLFTIKEAS